MLSERQQRVLQVLRDGPLVVDVLLRRALPDVPRQKALCTLSRLVEAGFVTMEGKKHLREIAGALVALRSLPERGGGSPAAAPSRITRGWSPVASP